MSIFETKSTTVWCKDSKNVLRFEIGSQEGGEKIGQTNIMLHRAKCSYLRNKFSYYFSFYFHFYWVADNFITTAVPQEFQNCALI